MRLLITGGTGFIGSHLAEHGRKLGAEVVVLGLADRPEEQANVELLRRQGIEVLAGSITYSHVTHPPARSSFIHGGNSAETDAVQSTIVLPCSHNTDPDGVSVKRR